MSEWPKFFPVDVPPKDAIEAAGECYLLVKNCPPCGDDFISSYEEKPSRDFGEEFWKACGMSCHTEQADAEKTRDRYYPLRKRRLAFGELPRDCGKMKSTPSQIANSHATLWLWSGAEIHNAFVCLEDEGS